MARRVTLAIADQAVIGGSGFLISLLLARWMDPEGFGAFTITFSAFLFAQNLLDSAAMEPLAVYGVGKYARQFRRYLGIVLTGGIAAAAVIATALFGAGLTVDRIGTSPLLAGALAGCAPVVPVLLMRGFIRQPLYVLGRQVWSVLASCTYLLVAVPILVLLEQIEGISPATAFIPIGMAGLAAALLTYTLALRPRWRGRPGDPGIGAVLSDHWRYARWAMLDRMLTWIPSNLFYFIIPLALSLAGSGALRAINLMTMPFLMTLSSLAPVLLPWFSRTYVRGGSPQLEQVRRRAGYCLLLAAAAYGLVLSLFGESVFHLAFRGQFDQHASPVLMAVAALHMLFAAATLSFDLGLRAMRQVKLTFLSRLVPTLITVSVGSALLSHLGLLGIFLGQVIGAMVMLVLVRAAYRAATGQVKAGRRTLFPPVQAE